MNEELKKAYEGIEDDLELVEYEGFYNHIKEWNFIKNYITNLQQENARLKDKRKQLEKFICYEQNRLLKATSHIYQDSFDKIKFVNSDIFEELKKVENKMKELFKEN